MYANPPEMLYQTVGAKIHILRSLSFNGDLTYFRNAAHQLKELFAMMIHRLR